MTTSFDWASADALLREHGDPAFILDLDAARTSAEALRAAFRVHYPDTEIALSYKTNDTPALLGTMLEAGLMAEVSCEHEAQLARRVGVPAARTVLHGPALPVALVTSALLDGVTVHLDSLRDVRVALDVADAHPGRRIAVGLRCGIPIGPGIPSRLGLDPAGPEFEQAVTAIRRHRGLRLAGLHCHVPDRSVASFVRRAEELIALAARHVDGAPDYLDIGGGVYGGVPPEGVRGRHPTAADYGAAVGAVMSAAYPDTGARPTLVLEPGTAVVARAMTYLTRVVAVKSTAHAEMATVGGSVFDISPLMRRDTFLAVVLRSGHSGARAVGATGTVLVGGRTLLEDDVLRARLPDPLAEGDILAFERVGAYSVSVPPVFGRRWPAVLAPDRSMPSGWQVLRAGSPA